MNDAAFDAFTKDVLGGKFKVEAVLSWLGLTQCQNTLVGDAMVRGISGGEKRRLTSAEVMMGTKPLYVMDEISTGLDSATLLSVIKHLKMLTQTLRYKLGLATYYHHHCMQLIRQVLLH